MTVDGSHCLEQATTAELSQPFLRLTGVYPISIIQKSGIKLARRISQHIF
jgi:hypothetical protein